MRRLNGDVLSGAVLVALGVYVIIEALGWNYMSEEGPGPGFFPLWYGIAMVVLSLVLVLRSAINPAPGAPADWTAIGRALLAWAAFAGCVALMQPLGFLLSFALLTLFVVAVMYGRPLKIAMAAAVGNAVVFYFLFVLALDLSLPVGPLGF
ncbi:MAG: tripartite tricarboxylate transporter TctB family protein [Burkholderiales bacterium]|nr:tripartite tricarboxylate transporter TctB family protein [Burkholderiales bacterium]MDP2399000.1 tripartite tricarboxylate transporter TctB family protein [Burkholderiales bacterium]